MFHTEELQQIIDQLQHSQGNGLGYFDTLMLIFKLIGLCAGPALFVISLIVILILGPRWISYKLISTPYNIKLYCCCFDLKREGNKYFLKLNLWDSIKRTPDYEKVLCKRGFLCYKIAGIFAVIVLLLLTPFLFNKHTNFLFWIFMVVIICIFLYIAFICNNEFGCESWSYIAKKKPLNEIDIKDQFEKKVMNVFDAIDPNDLKNMGKEEITKIINDSVNGQYCKAAVNDD